ncbi:MAG: glycosyltransferase [Patescibacteria group bacterium]
MGERAVKNYFSPHLGKKFWKRYYYSYVSGFLSFLVPDSLTFVASQDEAAAKNIIHIPEGDKFGCIVASDVAGYLNDVQDFFESAGKHLADDGRLIITQYSTLWEPVLKLASFLKLRTCAREQNWLSQSDLENFAKLSGFEVVKSGTKMLLPIYIPIISEFFNKLLANIFPFSRFGIFHYIVARKAEVRHVHNPSISIIVPARNEAGTIEKIAEKLPELGSFTEIIFIEGNSTDGTWQEIERVAGALSHKRRIKIAKQAGKGKGDAVRLGFEMAEGAILAIYDADMTVPPEEMHKFYNAIVQNRGDFINGSRLVYPLEKQSMRILNFFGNKFFSFAFGAILGESLKDTLCGTKVLWKKDYEAIKRGRGFFGDFDPFGDFDLLFGAAKQNLKIIDLPIHYKERKYGETNISRWKHGWLLLKMVVFAARKIKFI